MRTHILKFLTATVLLLVAATAAQATEASFGAPKWQGDRLDWCQNWSAGCGKVAADAFCKTVGFENATKFEQAPDIGSTQKTRLIATGAVCDQNFCDGFKYITCTKPNPSTVTVNAPKWKGDRLDWCQNWSTGCGKPAADSFCKATGFETAVAFQQAPDIGSVQRTRLIATGAVCDQGFCDGFKFIECKKS
jgi:hypothetical protein